MLSSLSYLYIARPFRKKMQSVQLRANVIGWSQRWHHIRRGTDNSAVKLLRVQNAPSLLLSFGIENVRLAVFLPLELK